MNIQQPPPPQDEWKQTRRYAIVMLLAVVITALSQASLVPPAWKIGPFGSPSLEPVSRNSSPPTASPPSTRPSAILSPSPSPSASPSVSAWQQNICGEWFSETSRKQYNFICQGQGLFEIYEVSDQGLNKTGSGNITEEGNVEADFISLTKKRVAHLKLRLLPDGRKMEGSWTGDDPREFGQLAFHKV